jgi:hypothetical protein
MTGGTDSSLCQADARAFEGLIVEHAGDMKRISSREALAIAHYLPQARQEKAITLLRSIGSDGLAEDLMSQSIARPDQSWLTHFCQSIEVAIMTPLLMETARRHSCNTVAIETGDVVAQRDGHKKEK